ncbi:MAG: hypothetical protein ACRDTE_02260 [Pseudonocardiaceae bacterium]
MSGRITVSVTDEQQANIDELAARLRAVGMEVDQVLPTVGVITGSVTRSQRTLIERAAGVAAVEDETSFQVAPPDSDVQ